MLSNQRSIYRKPRLNQFGLQLWLDTTADQNIVSDVNGKTSVAKDRSQYVRDFNQPVQLNQPTYVMAAINGLPALRFNGTSHFMNFSDPTLSWLNNTSFTIFYVATKTTKTTTSMIFGGSSTGTRSNLATGYIAQNTHRIVFGQDDANSIVPTVAPGDPELYVITYNKTDNSREVRRNGRVVGLGASNGVLSGMTDQALGRYLGVFGQFDLGEIIIYNRPLEAYERTQVERDLASKWTISDALVVVNPTPEEEILPTVHTVDVSLELVPGSPEIPQVGTAPVPGVGQPGDPDYVAPVPASPDYEPAVPAVPDSYNYVIDGAVNPTLNYVKKDIYVFNVDAVGQPFRIQSVPGAYDVLNEYTNGISNAGDDSGTIAWTIPANAPSVLYYVSENDPQAHGTINLI